MKLPRRWTLRSVMLAVAICAFLLPSTIQVIKSLQPGASVKTLRLLTNADKLRPGILDSGLGKGVGQFDMNRPGDVANLRLFEKRFKQRGEKYVVE